MALLNMGNTDTSSDEYFWLGADQYQEKDDYVAVFIPSQKRNGESLDHEYWCKEAVQTMSTLFGGATSMKGLGGWRDDEFEKKIKQEPISIVFSFMNKNDWNKENVFALRKFLHRMGREAEQGEIGLYKSGKYIPIRNYDHE